MLQVQPETVMTCSDELVEKGFEYMYVESALAERYNRGEAEPGAKDAFLLYAHARAIMVIDFGTLKSYIPQREVSPLSSRRLLVKSRAIRRCCRCESRGGKFLNCREQPMRVVMTLTDITSTGSQH